MQGNSKFLAGAPLVDFSGKTNLVELTNNFRELDVLVCNDSGAMHLANAFGCPVVAIFGPTDPSVTGPIFETPAIKIQSESGKSMESIEPKIIARCPEVISVTQLIGVILLQAHWYTLFYR